MTQLANISARLSKWAEQVWYKDPFIGVWLMPLGFFYSDFVKFRKFLYRLGILKSTRLPVLVIIVGNITVGGTGKTPLILWLAHWLQQQGYKPGIISRGFKGKAETWPQQVFVDSSAEVVGDEAVLLAKHSGCPVVVGPDRVAAAERLLQNNSCDIVLADDGLQHYALGRDIEIAVIDGQRRFGNGYCLPAGPLREPINRLQSVDLIIVNGKKYEENEYEMQLQGDTAINLVTGERKSLKAFVEQECHVLAGIGNPKRFFEQMQAAGLLCETVGFPDHHPFQADDIRFNDDKPVFMTEKDAVKCLGFAETKHWFVPVAAIPDPEFSARLLQLINNKNLRIQR